MARIGVISISDGRDCVHGRIVGFLRTVEGWLVAELTAPGHAVVRGRGPVGGNRDAVAVAGQVRAACELLGVTMDEFGRAG
ncbi:hypothetical protein [Nocardia acidivorans]|uniref:hypothetical protein n=1 Tax=Nocardia acidivorans TaxID=404580 RepID=UPI000A46E7E0|nr:hypothetical protein [Nocardia acidivorans]